MDVFTVGPDPRLVTAGPTTTIDGTARAKKTRCLTQVSWLRLQSIPPIVVEELLSPLPRTTLATLDRSDDLVALLLRHRPHVAEFARQRHFIGKMPIRDEPKLSARLQ
jgi:hypothetical protein